MHSRCNLLFLNYFLSCSNQLDSSFFLSFGVLQVYAMLFLFMERDFVDWPLVCISLCNMNMLLLLV